MTLQIQVSGTPSPMTDAEKTDVLTTLGGATTAALTAHTGNTSNPHGVTKAQVGLGNADNTADADKPVSTAQSTAIGAAITAHTDAPDPHPQYLTPADADTLYAPISVTGVTNLAATAAPTVVTITSDTGTDATIAGADATNAGAMLPAQVTKLAGIATGATANAADATLLNRANHTGTQTTSTITGLDTALAGKATTAQGAKADTAIQPSAQLTQAAVTAATAAGVALLDAADAPAQRTALGLGTAATTASTAYATAAQGAKADTALQPGSQLTQAAVTGATAAGVALIGAADAAAQRAAMGAMASSLPAMQTAYDAGTTAQQAAFQASVSGYPSSGHLPRLLVFGCSIAQQCNAFLQSVTSTTSVESKAGTNTLTVANGALFTAGQAVSVPLYNARIWRATILSIAANVLTLTENLPAMIRNGSAVTITTRPTFADLNLGYGAVNAAVALLGGPVEVVPTYGYGGAIFVQMYADLERDLRYYRPKYVALHMFENDLTGTVAGGAATIEQFKGWARMMARLCLDYGATPLVYSSMPYYNSGAGTGIPASRAADYDALAAYIGSGKSGQLAIDVPGAWGDNSVSTGWLDTSNPTWPRAPLAGWTDGVHPLVAKRFAVGLIAAPVLAQMLPASHSLADFVLSNREISLMSGTGGGAANLQAGSIVPKSHTAAAYGTALATTSRNGDGSLKIYVAWPGASNRVADYVIDKYTFTIPTTWPGGTQRFKAFARIRINTMTNVSQIYPDVILSTGENHTGSTGVDMCDTIPAGDGRIIEMETPVFAFGVGTTTVIVEFMIRPKTLASPSGAVIDVDVIEMGLVAAHPETPHNYV